MLHFLQEHPCQHHSSSQCRPSSMSHRVVRGRRTRREGDRDWQSPTSYCNYSLCCGFTALIIPLLSLQVLEEKETAPPPNNVTTDFPPPLLSAWEGVAIGTGLAGIIIVVVVVILIVVTRKKGGQKR